MIRPPSDRVLALAVPALLVLVAAVQQVLVRTQHLTPWKGGGFGMFAGIDHGRNRMLRVELRTDSGSVAVDASKLRIMESRGERILTMPSDGMLGRLAREVRERRWVLAGEASPSGARVARPMTRADSTAPLVVRSVRLTVLRQEYDAARRSLRLVPMLEREYAPAAPP